MQTSETTSVSTEGGADPQHPTTRSRDDHPQTGEGLKLNVLARMISTDGAIATKQASHRRLTTDAADHPIVQTKAQRFRARIQFATLCWTLYLAGWNDATTGPLLPRIQKVYNVGVLMIVHGGLRTEVVDMDTWTGQLYCGISDFRVCLHCGCYLDSQLVLRR